MPPTIAQNVLWAAGVSGSSSTFRGLRPGPHLSATAYERDYNSPC